MIIALILAVYMIVGAIIGFGALRLVLKELEEGDIHNNHSLEKTKNIINKIGLETFLLSMLIIFSVFWLPLILNEILFNKNKKR